MRHRALALAAALAFGTAASITQAAPRAKPHTAAMAAEPMRLGTQVQPQAYTLALTLDPAQPRYTGQVRIAVQLAAPTRQITLHAKDLRISQVQLSQGALTQGAQVKQVDAERVRLQFARTLPRGTALLQLDFEATLQEQDVYGLFRQRDGANGPWLAISQFEAVGARLAFPLFDEPGWKVPWTVSLTVPESLTALSNSPVASSMPAARPGWKTVQFQPTPPLPSYLLALAVGPFELVEAGRSGPLPLRFVAPPGRGAESAFAAAITAPIVQRLEDYFGMPFPFAKLDSLAIPVTVNFGAMEHPGLITYASNLMLAKPDEVTPAFERDYVATAAHELAHQWFGNLVTMAWWDDLWLNESFASWMEVRITSQLKPGWHWALRSQQARADAMRADRLVSARRIQQPILRDEDMGNLWDAITYQKGQTVLGMFEQWLGEDRFRAGVRRYMQRHAWGNATGNDFLAALGEADATLPDALRSFTSQPGIPLLKVALDCTPGSAPQLRLQQERLLPLGSPGAAGTAAQRWQIPVQVRTPAGESRLLLTGLEASLPLPDAQCPAWVQANAGGLGYYRPAYQGDGLLRLAAAPGLSDGEVLALLDDARGLHEAGLVDSATVLALVQRFAQHPRHEVVELAADLLAHLKRLVPATQQAAYAERWRSLFGAQALALGWLPAGPEADDQRMLLRTHLLQRVADLGEHAELRAQARTLALQALVQPGSLPVAMRQPVLSTAAIEADDALFDALVAALHASNDRRLRTDLLVALGHVRRPDLAQRARGLLLDPSVDIRDSLWRLLSTQADRPETRDAALAWVQQQFKPLSTRLGRDDPASLPRLFEGACSAEGAQAIRSTFAPQMARFQGGQLSLQKALEAVDLCVAWRARQASGL